MINLASSPVATVVGTSQTVAASATSGLPVAMTVISGTATVNGLVITPTAGNRIVELGVDKLGKVSIKLLDAAGKLVFTENVEATNLNFKHEINMTDYASGVYMMTLTTEGKTAVKRIVKQ